MTIPSDAPDYLQEENKLSEEDIDFLVPIIARGLSNHIGKENQIKAKDMLDGLYNNMGIEISEVKLKRVIRYIRHHNIVSCVMSLGGGYWVAISKEEIANTIQMFHDRCKAEWYSMLHLIDQAQQRYDCDIDFDVEGNVIIK